MPNSEPARVSLEPLPIEQYAALPERERMLQHIGDVIAYWLKFVTDGFHGGVRPDSHIMFPGANAPPHWPTVAQLTKWLEVLRDSPPTSPGWQDIATAPKDGRWIVAWMPSTDENGYLAGESAPVLIRWQPPREGFGTEDAAWDIPFEDAWHTDAAFTHWIPLPAAPECGR